MNLTTVDTYNLLPKGLYRLLTTDRSVQHCLRYVNLKTQERYIVTEELNDVNFVKEVDNELYLVTYGGYCTTRYLPEVYNYNALAVSEQHEHNNYVREYNLQAQAVEKFICDNIDMEDIKCNLKDIPVFTNRRDLYGVYHVSNINRRESTRVAGHKYLVATYTSLDNGKEYVSFFNNVHDMLLTNVSFINTPTSTNCELYVEFFKDSEDHQYAPANSTTDDLFKDELLPLYYDFITVILSEDYCEHHDTHRKYKLHHRQAGKGIRGSFTFRPPSTLRRAYPK